MKTLTPPLLPRLLCLIAAAALMPLAAEPLYSPAWGFRIDLPPDFELSGGDGRDKFSFISAGGISFELVAYPASVYESIDRMAADVGRRLGNAGDISVFDYYGQEAALMELSFGGVGGNEGWALCIELAEAAPSDGRPKLLALAFGPAGEAGYQPLYLSLLDSVAPAAPYTFTPGPITEFAWPRKSPRQVRLLNSRAEARIDEADTEAAQFLVDREFAVLRLYSSGPLWQEAWIRFYRAIFRDSFDRLRHIAAVLKQEWEADSAALPQKALEWVQAFTYERDLMGSDFVNLVSAAVEGRGDCDSRSLLWAVILSHADIPAAVMVSREYSHAMGLAAIDGSGARFEFAGKSWLVAETTAPVALGLINSKTSDSEKWIGINFY
jgi:hypothetical protein